MTNATKALLITFFNSLLGLCIAFGLVLTDAQTGAVMLFLNSALALFVALTYKDSPKRIPDEKVPDAG